ncbi:copper resistance protein NlpE [Pigmentiphaga sp. D-2]|uniref:copper resistance protein NlpE n=1 Tax=Pigmentiphaga sp. D-2 TaxID=1002116 RepID=UPI001053B858|nr:copper resistance protein NlpE [Pigmentiphaga sp. D-2]
MKTAAFACLAAVLIAGCGTPSREHDTPAASPVVDGHNARNTLDWDGVYEGTLPCADCPGIRTRLTLRQDGRYELETQYLDRQPRVDRVEGSFTWQPDGTRITLDQAAGGRQYFVAEGRLIQLYMDGTRPQGPLAGNHELQKVENTGR